MKRVLLLLFMLLVGVGLYFWLPIEPKWSYVQDDCQLRIRPSSWYIQDGIIRIVRNDGTEKFLDAVDGHDFGHDFNDKPLEDVNQSPNGRYLVGAMQETREVWLLDRQTGALRKLEFSSHVVDRIHNFSWSPKGGWLVYERATEQWLVRLSDGSLHGKWVGFRYSKRVSDSFDSNEQVFASVVRDNKGGVKAVLWDLMQGCECFQFPEEGSKSAFAVISSNGRWLLASHCRALDDATAVLLELHSNQAPFQLAHDRLSAASFSPDGGRLACKFFFSYGNRTEIWDVTTRKLLATHNLATIRQNDVLDASLSHRFKVLSEGPSVVCMDAISNAILWEVPLPFKIPIYTLQWCPGNRNTLIVHGRAGVAVVDADKGMLLDLPQMNRVGWASYGDLRHEQAVDSHRVVVQQIQVEETSWLKWLFGESKNARVCLRVFDLQASKEVIPGGVTTWPMRKSWGLFSSPEAMSVWMSPKTPHLTVCVPIGESSFWIASYDLEARPWARILFITLFAGAFICLMGRLVRAPRRPSSSGNLWGHLIPFKKSI